MNGGVLRLPSGSAGLRALLDLSTARVVIPPYWGRREKVLQFARSIVSRHVPLEKLEWGAIGPRALTYYVRAFRLSDEPAQPDVFYPLHFTEAEKLFAENGAEEVEKTFTPDTRSVHLWNEMIKSYKKAPPPAGSFVAKMCRRFNVEPV